MGSGGGRGEFDTGKNGRDEKGFRKRVRVQGRGVEARIGHDKIAEK